MKKTWNDVTVGQYEKIVDIMKGDDDEMEKLVRIVALLADLDENTVRDTQLTTFNSLMNDYAAFLGESPKIKGAPTTRLNINGRKYRVDLAPQNFTVAQCLDYSSIVSPTTPLSKILSVIIIPQGKKYGDYDFGEVISDIREISVVEGQKIANFFTKQYRAYSLALVGYMKRTLKKTKNTEKKKEIMEKLETLKKSLDSIICI